MKLYMSPASPFARKVRILVRELDLTKNVEEIPTNPATSDELRRINPLGKIPALVLDDGSVLVDSPVICEYLNDLGGGKFFAAGNIFSHHTSRWRVATLQALGDGLAEAAVLRTYEGRRPAELQSADVIAHYTRAITATLDMLERLAPKFAEHPTIGEIAVGCALDYLDFRHGDLGWREGRPQLAAWLDKFSQYASVVATKPMNLA